MGYAKKIGRLFVLQKEIMLAAEVQVALMD